MNFLLLIYWKVVAKVPIMVTSATIACFFLARRINKGSFGLLVVFDNQKY